MNLLDIILIGIGLSMDAVCVSISNGICMKQSKLKHALSGACAFGIFQGIMPIIGFLAGSLFLNILSKYSNIVVFLVFFILGTKMVYDGFHSQSDEAHHVMTFRLLLVQAIATSIDAMAVGVSFTVLNVNVYYASFVIAAITFLLSFIAFLFGKKIGALFQKNAGIFGGILILAIALKILFELIL